VIRLFSNIFDSGAELSAAIGLRQDFDAPVCQAVSSPIRDVNIKVRRFKSEVQQCGIDGMAE
jgi:hypothetical protein